MAATAATSALVAALPPPSPFAAMLRRSKFATYDPQIAQIYTAYGGYAHRGDWGLKRPLAVRKRDKYITIQTIDSPEQQTEWRTGEPESRWIRRWGEVGTEVQMRGIWDRQTVNHDWVIDSDFTLGTKDGAVLKMQKARVQKMKDAELLAEGGRVAEAGEEQVVENAEPAEQTPLSAYNAVVPNIMAMSPKEFESYVEKLRAQRPQFKQFLKNQVRQTLAARAKDNKVMATIVQEPFEEAQHASALLVRKAFLQHSVQEQYRDPSSRMIEQRPHRNAGLSYALASPLTNFFLVKPQPGRQITVQEKPMISFGGMVSTLAGSSRVPDNLSLRMASAKLLSTPRVVGQEPSGLEGVGLETTVRDTSEMALIRRSLHKPGSRKYVGQARAHLQGRIRRPSMMSPRSREKASSVPLRQADSASTKHATTTTLLNTLNRIVRVGRD